MASRSARPKSASATHRHRSLERRGNASEGFLEGGGGQGLGAVGGAAGEARAGAGAAVVAHGARPKSASVTRATRHHCSLERKGLSKVGFLIDRFTCDAANLIEARVQR